MTEEVSFRDLIRRVRAGDGQAAEELVRRYEPAVRRAVRARLTNPHLRRLIDSVDICQSVLASFFLRAASGQYELEQPDQLLRLLVSMARNKVVKQAHKQQAARRDYRRLEESGPPHGEFVDRAASPSQTVADRELLEKFRGRLSDEERRLADLRALGHPWAEIAAEFGGSPDALRMQLHRAIDRVWHELGLET